MDEIIECNKQNFSLRKILGEEGWKIYSNSKSDKVKELVRLKVFMDLSAMELGFARIKKLEEEIQLNTTRKFFSSQP